MSTFSFVVRITGCGENMSRVLTNCQTHDIIVI
nr:MAG TPA: hypothetical protein [Caudoviricetes sp.]